MYTNNRGPRTFGGGNDRFDQDRYVPVKVGDELAVTIEAVGEKGDGVAKKDGFVLFVPGTKQGQHVTIRVTKVFKKVGFAEVVAGAPKPAEAAGATEESSEMAEEAAPVQEDSGSVEDTEDFGSDLDEDKE